MTDQPRRATPTRDDPDDGALDDDLSVTALEPASAAPRWQRLPGDARRRLRQVWRASGVVALVALVAIVFVAVAPHLPRPAQPRFTPPYTALQAPSDAARCLTPGAWSPDGRQVAAIASGSCQSLYLAPAPTADNLLIFDAATGRRVAAYVLDSAVSAALIQSGVENVNISNSAIEYFETDWSPDGQLMAAPFAFYSEQFVGVGVAVVTLTGTARGHVRVLLEAPDAQNLTQSTAPDNGFDPVPAQRWDLTQGAQTTIYLAPALAYHWLPSDVLVADEPLPASAAAPAPVEAPAPTPTGDSIGGQAFSLWRVGYLTLVNAQSCDSNVATRPLSAPYAYLTLTSPVWSPDGRYLLEASAQARLPAFEAHTASADKITMCDSGLAPDQLPSAPLHDKGLQSALTLLDPLGGNQLTLAWSTDGRRLAAAMVRFTPNTGAVVVYDCVTGAALQRFTGDEFVAHPVGNYLAEYPVWSPDGAHLLLTINGPVAKLVILGPQALDA